MIWVTTMSKIVVMGGSFNPITKAHLQLFKSAMHAIGATKGIIVLTGDHYDKVGLCSYEHRSNMVRLVIDDRITLCDYEQVTKPHPKSIETLDYLQQQYPNDDLYFMMGLDNFASLPHWYHPEALLSRHHVMVSNRSHLHHLSDYLSLPFFKPFLDRIVILETNSAYLEISSTKARKLLKEKKYEEASYSINYKIIDYIKMNHLYLN